jgi:hypothetical protein
MYINGTEVGELHAIDIVRATMLQWFEELGVRFNPLDELDGEFYDWGRLYEDDEGAQVSGSFEVHGKHINLTACMDWYGPNVAVIQRLTVLREGISHQLGMQVARREHAYNPWHVKHRHSSAEKTIELKKLFEVQ